MKNIRTIQFDINNPQVGTFLRNNMNRIFCITKVNSTEIFMDEYNPHGPIGRTIRYERSSFTGLFRGKYWEPTIYICSIKTGRWFERRDMEIDRMIGAQRCLTKQTINIFR